MLSIVKVTVKFSHLNERKFRHNFKDALSPMCDDCGSETDCGSCVARFLQQIGNNSLIIPKWKR